MSRPALGLIQPIIQWVPAAFCLGVKRPGRKADHSLPSSAEVKECVGLYLHYVFMAWCLGTGTTLPLPYLFISHSIFAFYVEEKIKNSISLKSKYYCIHFWFWILKSPCL
jgi:hypothetical protein